jgi:hypothetical protein
MYTQRTNMLWSKEEYLNSSYTYNELWTKQDQISESKARNERELNKSAEDSASPYEEHDE